MPKNKKSLRKMRKSLPKTVGDKKRKKKFSKAAKSLTKTIQGGNGKRLRKGINVKAVSS